VESKESCIGREIQEFILLKPEDLVTAQAGENHVFEASFKTLNGVIRQAEITLSATTYLGEDAYLAFIRDITKRKKNAERLEAIYQQAVAISSTNTIQEISETTLNIMESLFESHTITFHIVEQDSLRTLGIRGAQYLDLNAPILGKGITAKSAREQQSILVNDTSQASDFVKGATDAKSELAVPAKLMDETIAVLNVESTKLNDFTEDDRKLLETLAYHVGFAFNRIKQQETEEQEKGERSKRLDYALGRLDHAERVSTLVRGELQRNILSILNASLMLRQKPDMATRLSKSIDTNAENAQIVSEKIRETVAISALEEGLIEINHVVRGILDKTVIPRNIRIKIQYDERMLIVDFEENTLSRILRNLMNNSIEAMPMGGTLSLKVSSKGDNAVIEVKDSGSGISKSAMDQLFQPFNTTKTGHSGLGLAFCKNAIESAGGSLELKYTSDRGTTFNVVLPVRKRL
jgi:signal transduction histidine kinase